MYSVSLIFLVYSITSSWCFTPQKVKEKALFSQTYLSTFVLYTIPGYFASIYQIFSAEHPDPVSNPWVLIYCTYLMKQVPSTCGQVIYPWDPASNPRDQAPNQGWEFDLSISDLSIFSIFKKDQKWANRSRRSLKKIEKRESIPSIF